MERRAALYARLSKEDEGAGRSESVKNQLALLREYAEREGIEVYAEYADDGWSGTNFDRPAFKRMIADIEAKKVNMVVTKDMSRLGRDYIATGYYMERYFPEKGVRYVSLLDGIDSDAECAANDMTPFRAIMNDMYAKDISKKIRSVKRDKQRRGLFIGGKAPYGYAKHPEQRNLLVIDETAAHTVCRVFDMALSDMSCRAIAERLNSEGVPPPSVYAGLRPKGSTRWSGERIAEMLRCATYMGNMVQGRRARVSYKSPKCARLPKERWAIARNTHEPIVDSKTFEGVQRVLESRARTRRRIHDHPFKGLIRCKECGETLGLACRKNAAGEDVLYFICRTYRQSRGCTAHTARADRVAEAVAADIAAVLARHADADMLLRIADEAHAPRELTEAFMDNASFERSALLCLVESMTLSEDGEVTVNFRFGEEREGDK